MPKKIINEIITEPDSANSAMLDGENKPAFLTRKRDGEAREDKKELDEYFKDRKKKRAFRPLVYIGGLVVLAIIFFVGSNMFTSAKVAITPRMEQLSLDDQITLAKNPGEGALGFSVATVQSDAEVPVTSTGTKRVERKATGRITIFNSSTDKPLKLIANTRFERPDGKVYRIQSSVTIPGYKIIGGKTVPGSLEATIFASEPGAEYNGDPTDFTVPGLKGDPSYDKVSARSTTALTGGYAGDVYVISESEKASARTALQGELEKALRDKLAAQLASGMIVFENSVQLSYGELEEPPVVAGAAAPAGGKVSVRERGTLRALVISGPDFAKFIARSHIAGYGGESVEIKDLSTVSITTSQTIPKDLDSIETLTASVKGAATISWIFSIEELKTKLAGMKKGEASKVFSEFPPIESAKIYMRPPWSRTIPKNIEKITIEVENVADTAEAKE